MKVSNLTSDNGGCSTLRVISFWSLLAFGRPLLERVGFFVSRSFDIIMVGWVAKRVLYTTHVSPASTLPPPQPPSRRFGSV